MTLPACRIAGIESSTGVWICNESLRQRSGSSLESIATARCLDHHEAFDRTVETNEENEAVRSRNSADGQDFRKSGEAC